MILCPITKCIPFALSCLFALSCFSPAIIVEQEQEDVCYANSTFLNCPFYYHFAPNYFITDYLGRKAIPSESLDDIELASRLGFAFIEANIHETSDGNYICIHGENGMFGPQVKSVDESVISSYSLRKTKIQSVTLDWIKTYVRYDSDYREYQTTLPSLEEFCEACKRYNIGILAGVGGRREPVDICVRYLGDRVIVYGPSHDIRSYFNGSVFTWNNKPGISIGSLLEEAEYYGFPYICSLGSVVLSELKERNDLERFIELMHNKGYLVGWASVYSKELDSMNYRKMGMDISASGHEVNRFEGDYGYYDIHDINHTPYTNGHFDEDCLLLSSGDYLSCGSDDIIQVGKGALEIVFKGRIRIDFGSCGQKGDRYDLCSDGDESLVFSDFFYRRSTRLFIESLSDDTRISHMVYLLSVN